MHCLARHGLGIDGSAAYSLTLRKRPALLYVQLLESMVSPRVGFSRCTNVATTGLDA